MGCNLYVAKRDDVPNQAGKARHFFPAAAYIILVLQLPLFLSLNSWG